jgi:hypothetical protein
MDAGEPYNDDTFMFVATLGEPERYKEQAKMLKSAAGLTAGRIVGIAQGNTLGCVGTVGERPLLMEANLGNPSNPENEQPNRNLEALVLFRNIVKYADMDVIDHPIVIKQSGVKESPHMVTLLCSDTEPTTHEPKSNAFDEANQLLIGADEVMAFVTENNDVIGQKQFAELTTRLARGSLGIIAVNHEQSQASIN